MIEGSGYIKSLRMAGNYCNHIDRVRVRVSNMTNGTQDYIGRGDKCVHALADETVLVDLYA